MSAPQDLLAGVEWSCGSTAPGAATSPGDLGEVLWLGAQVPGTAASAMLAAGSDVALLRDYDRFDWWFRCGFAAPDTAGACALSLGGLATVADVWLNGTHLLHSENMFVAHELPVDLQAENDLVIRFSALAPLLARRRPRPRWKTGRVLSQNIRWFRTTLLGRTGGNVASPAPVGPWRPVRMVALAPVALVGRRIRAVPLETGTGCLEVVLRVRGLSADSRLRLQVEGTSTGVDRLPPDEEGIVEVSSTLTVPGVRLWWPCTHGDQPLYTVELVVDDVPLIVGRVGFRTLEVDRSDGGFTFVCNGVPIFIRGSVWMPPDPVNLAVPAECLRTLVALVREANLNMIRISGNLVYPDPSLLDLCDEYGVLVWQDAMFAFVDVPDDPELTASTVLELEQLFEEFQGRPCLAIVCGGADTEEQAQYHGLDAGDWSSAMARETIPPLLEGLLPGTPYLRSTPGDSPLVTTVNRGVSHYFGVGPYLHPVTQLRRDAVRFTAECLPFSAPPEPFDVTTHTRATAGLGRDPWLRDAAHRDANAGWDIEDVRDRYTTDLFGVDVLRLRQQDPERADELFRATNAELFERVWSEWRRGGSRCSGAITFAFRDLLLGPGAGLVDVVDRPKVTWYVLRRLMRPVAVLLTDEGLSGLSAHVVNDTAVPFRGTLRVDLIRNGETWLDSATESVEVSPHGALTVDTSLMFGGFRDLSFAYRFGEPGADVVAASLLDRAERVVSRAVHLPLGPHRPRQLDVGLSVSARQSDDGAWVAAVQTVQFAQWVAFDLPGWRPADSWFHLLPGERRMVGLAPRVGASKHPTGTVRALNSARTYRIATDA